MQGQIFSGNIFVFHSFDVGDDINLEKIKDDKSIDRKLVAPSKYFKNYHIPLAIELPRPHNQENSKCISTKLHNFGVVSLVYKIPFTESLDSLRAKINDIDNIYNEQSVLDAGVIFKQIKDYIKQPRFFHLRRSYLLIQINPESDTTDIVKLKSDYGSTIASILRFETETLSEYQKNDILDGAIGYFRGDLIIIDTEAAFVYDDEYEDFLDFFEFANIQQLELQYFDRVLDAQLNKVYKRETQGLPLKSFLPFVSEFTSDPIDDLGKLRVDISVITEQLENSVKFAGEPYYSELYQLLADKLELKNWKDSIDKKLTIVQDIRNVYQHKTDIVREDLLSVLVIILIAIELILGILSYFK